MGKPQGFKSRGEVLRREDSVRTRPRTSGQNTPGQGWVPEARANVAAYEAMPKVEKLPRKDRIPPGFPTCEGYKGVPVEESGRVKQSSPDKG